MSNESLDNRPIPLLHYPGKLEEVIGPKLTYRQELFCRYYTQNEQVCMNGTASYAAAYGFDLDSLSRIPLYGEDKKTITQESDRARAENHCAVAASRFLRNPKISNRVMELFNEMLRDDVIDAQLVQIIMYAPKPSDRVAAIREYNALKQRIIKKLDLTTKGESLNSEDKSKVEKALESIT